MPRRLDLTLHQTTTGAVLAIVVLSTGVGWAVFIRVAIVHSLPYVYQSVLPKTGCLVQDGRNAVAICVHGLIIYRHFC
jgi:hypothetical protein